MNLDRWWRKRQRLGAKIHMEYSLVRIYVSGVKANGTDRDTRGVPWPHVCIKLQSYPTEVGAFRWRTCGPHPNCGSTSPLHSQSPIAPCYLSTRVVESFARALCARRSFCWPIPDVVREWGPTSKRAPNWMGPSCLSFLIRWCVWVMCAVCMISTLVYWSPKMKRLIFEKMVGLNLSGKPFLVDPWQSHGRLLSPVVVLSDFVDDGVHASSHSKC